MGLIQWSQRQAYNGEPFEFVKSCKSTSPIYPLPSICHNDAPTPVMLSPAISPAAAVIAKRCVTLGQRQLTAQVMIAPRAIISDTDAGKTNASPKAAALGR